MKRKDLKTTGIAFRYYQSGMQWFTASDPMKDALGPNDKGGTVECWGEDYDVYDIVMPTGTMPKGRVAKRIIEEMKARNNFGVTDRMLALVTGYPVPSIRRTRGQLVKAGILVKMGRTSKLAATVG